jgi:hypothetical protein
MSLKRQLREYVHAGFSGIWVVTREPDEAQREIQMDSKEEGWNLESWDVARGILGDGKGEPAYPLQRLKPVVNGDGKHTTNMMILHNYHRFLNNPMIVQQLFNRVIDGKMERCHVVVLSHTRQLPAEIEKVFALIEHELPDAGALNQIANELHEEPENPHTAHSESVRAAAGLTRYEAEGAFALSLSRHGKITPNAVWEMKQSMLKKSGLLEMYRGKETFLDLGGMQGLKTFARTAITAANGIKPKGILLLGVPGTGKSAFAKALGNETNRPTLVLDIGSLYGSLVGQTEERVREALRIADAMSPCILFVDEIEKALSGVGGDSGVSTRLFGTLLTWLNDHESDVFFIGTCNDISKLPPEFARAERFDGVFFIDLPREEEKASIWRLYEAKYEIKNTSGSPARPDASNWTGAEIKACCRLAALLKESQQEAAKRIVPVALTAASRIQALKDWAHHRCLDAETGAIFQNYATSETKKRRSIKGYENN